MLSKALSRESELQATVEVLTQKNIELQKELRQARIIMSLAQGQGWRNLTRGEFITITDNAMHRTQ